MPTFEVNFDVYCACGRGLCNQSTTDNRRGTNSVRVEPCDACLEEEYEKGRRAGYDEAEKEFAKGEK